MDTPGAAIRLLRRSVAGVLLLLAHPAAAGGLQLRYEPLFTVGESTITDASGARMESSTTVWTHLASARLDRPVFDYLRLSASTSYEWGLGSASTDGRRSEFDSRFWNTHAQLTVGPRELNFTPFYTRSERSSETLQGGTRGFSPRRLRELYGAYAAWRPEGLPSVGARFTRSDQLEGGGLVVDASTTQASLDLTYVLRTTDLRYRLDYDNPVNHLAGTEAVNVRHQARAAYGDRFLDDRVSLTSSYVLSVATSDTRVSGTGGVVETRQAPVAGLSATEVPPATATSITLAQTPSLVDGDRTAGVGVDLGLGSDTAPRHIGAQLVNAITPVSMVHVWVHQPLPEAVVRAFSWAAYRSDDNLSWTPVSLTGAVAFGTFDNRFEIPIERTEARYLKVVTRPLPSGTILDPRFADILVTEIELLDRVAAADVRGRSERTGGAGSALLRAKLLAERRLFYDLALNLTHSSQDQASGTDTLLTYDVTNGLSYDQALGRVLNFTARLDRTDSRQRSRDQAATRLTASLGATPVPTLTSTATYSGTLTQAPEGRQLSNTVLASVQAQPYQGFGVQASGSYGIIAQRDETTRTHSAAVATTVTPHPALTLSGTFTESSSRRDAAGTTQQSTRRLEGGVTFAPVEAIYLAGSVGRVEVSERPPQRVAHVTASVRPFPRGAVYLSFQYDEAFDYLFDTRTRTWGPSLRWNIFRGNYLESSYTVQDVSSPLHETHLSLFALKLSVSL